MRLQRTPERLAELRDYAVARYTRECGVVPPRRPPQVLSWWLWMAAEGLDARRASEANHEHEEDQ